MIGRAQASTMKADESAEWDDPAEGKGKITLNLYFKRQPCPKEGSQVSVYY